MVETHQHFGKRVKHLNKKNARFAHGYYTTVRNDGLIIAHPVRRSSGFPFKIFLLLIVMFFGFKALVLSAIGPGAYQIRLNTLKDGTFIEQAGAFALGMDPVTLAISSQIGPIFRG